MYAHTVMLVIRMLFFSAINCVCSSPWHSSYRFFFTFYLTAATNLQPGCNCLWEQITSWPIWIPNPSAWNISSTGILSSPPSSYGSLSSHFFVNTCLWSWSVFDLMFVWRKSQSTCRVTVTSHYVSITLWFSTVDLFPVVICRLTLTYGYDVLCDSAWPVRAVQGEDYMVTSVNTVSAK